MTVLKMVQNCFPYLISPDHMLESQPCGGTWPVAAASNHWCFHNEMASPQTCRENFNPRISDFSENMHEFYEICIFLLNFKKFQRFEHEFVSSTVIMRSPVVLPLQSRHPQNIFCPSTEICGLNLSGKERKQMFCKSAGKNAVDLILMI